MEWFVLMSLHIFLQLFGLLQGRVAEVVFSFGATSFRTIILPSVLIRLKATVGNSVNKFECSLFWRWWKWPRRIVGNLLSFGCQVVTKIMEGSFCFLSFGFRRCNLDSSLWLRVFGWSMILCLSLDWWSIEDVSLIVQLMKVSEQILLNLVNWSFGISFITCSGWEDFEFR